LTITVSALVLAACGGSDEAAAPPDPGISQADRIMAATTTAQGNPQCAASEIGAFYWELGDGSGALASGSVGNGAAAANTNMPVYSASKWLYAAWTVQERGLQNSDVPYLNFTSGHTEFGPPACPLADTVAACGESDGLDPATVGRFLYDSGHMQFHARDVLGLGDAGNAELAAGLQAALGVSGLAYGQPQRAAGVVTTPASYASFLRPVLRGELVMADGLGTDKVCANPDTCANADSAPSTKDETWNYSLGHWVEDDPVVGDHAYSSAGAGGFYPWISNNRTLYGIVARDRVADENAGFESAECGRRIRQAWVTGQTVNLPTPTP
jgi:hypothetical protein